MRTNIHHRTAAMAAVVAFCAAAATAVLWAQTSPQIQSFVDPRLVHGIGTPSEQHRVSFEGNPDGNDVVKQVMVKPGDLVKAGDVLMVEDTDQAEAEMALLKAASEATGAIEEAKVTIDAKSQLVDMYKNLPAGNTTGLETINALMDRDVAKARLHQAEDDHNQRQLAYQKQLVKLRHMTLRSPIDGVVESVNLFAGEIVDASSDKQGACFIVANNPLWIEFHLDARRAGRLALHDPVEVAFPDQPNTWIAGEVIFLDPMVDYVGQTRTVRVSIPNPDQRPSGLPMIVQLPAKVGDESGAIGSVTP